MLVNFNPHRKIALRFMLWFRVSCVKRYILFSFFVDHQVCVCSDSWFGRFRSIYFQWLHLNCTWFPESSLSIVLSFSCLLTAMITTCFLCIRCVFSQIQLDALSSLVNRSSPIIHGELHHLKRSNAIFWLFIVMILFRILASIWFEWARQMIILFPIFLLLSVLH